MPFLTTIQLVLIITILAIACALLAYTLWEVSREKRKALLENMELHLANNRLHWETEMVKAELRTTCKVQGIPVPGCCQKNRSPRHG